MNAVGEHFFPVAGQGVDIDDFGPNLFGHFINLGNDLILDVIIVETELARICLGWIAQPYGRFGLQALEALDDLHVGVDKVILMLWPELLSRVIGPQHHDNHVGFEF